MNKIMEGKMKKVLFLILAAVTAFVLSGCGQDVNVTVYNHSGVVPSGDQYIGITVEADGSDSLSFFPTENSLSDGEITEGSSRVLKVKEGKTVSVNAWGQYFVTGADDSLSLETFEVGPQTAVVYGGFPSAPDWYAAVFMNEITIYKK